MKPSYDKWLIEESGGLDRSFWKMIKKILPGEKKVTSPNIKIDRVSSDKKCTANTCNKSGKQLGMLGRLCRSLTRESANVVCCSLIRPILEYCVGVWAVSGKVTNKALKPSKTGLLESNLAMDVLQWPILEEC